MADKLEQHQEHGIVPVIHFMKMMILHSYKIC